MRIEILRRMKEVYTEKSGLTVAQASDIGLRLEVLAGELAALYQQCQQVEQDIFPHRCRPQMLDAHGAMRGVERKPAVAATGKVTFRRESGAQTDIVVPKGTLVGTLAQPQVVVATQQEGQLKAGDVEITLPAICTEKGALGNCAPHMFQQMVSPLADFSSVTNPQEFSGGADTESDQDFRQRVVAHCQQPSNSMNASYYRSIALQHPGIDKVAVLPRFHGLGTASIVVVAQHQQAIEELRALLVQHRGLGIKLQVVAATPVEIAPHIDVQVDSGYTFQAVTAAATEVAREFVNQLEIGQELRPSHLGARLLQVDGLADYRWVAPESPPVVGADQVLTLGPIQWVKA